MGKVKMVLCSKCKKEIEKNAKICPYCKAKRVNPILGIILLSIGLLLALRNGCSTSHAQNIESSPIDLKSLYSIVSSMELGEELVTYYRPETKISNNMVIQIFKQKKDIYRDESKANFRYNFDITYRIEDSNTIIMATSGILEKHQHPDLLFVTAMENNDFYAPVYTLFITAFMLSSANDKGLVSKEQFENIITRLPERSVIDYPIANLATYIHSTVQRISPFKWKYSTENKILLNRKAYDPLEKL